MKHILRKKRGDQRERMAHLPAEFYQSGSR